MIAQGDDSVAAKLHYPGKAKAEKKEAAVQFYCEVGADGIARHRWVITDNNSGPFRYAVQVALEHGRFAPARVGGKAVPVMMGGTVFFISGKSQPTILVSLTTADKGKAASGSNYVQPQMLRSYADIERKMYKWESLLILNRPNAVAEVMMDVDQNGNLTNTKITAEPIKGGGLGTILSKGCEGAKFIPAHANGKRVAGQFNLPINFNMVGDPDTTPGGHLKPRER